MTVKALATTLGQKIDIVHRGILCRSVIVRVFSHECDTGPRDSGVLSLLIMKRMACDNKGGTPSINVTNKRKISNCGR